MTEAKRVVSTTDAVSNFFESKDENQAFDQHVKCRMLVIRLASLRAAKGVTQGEIAKLLGCQQARISKLESGVDADVRAADLEAYAKATGTEISILISERGKSLAEQIKYHAFSIRAAFLKLVKLAHKDGAIAQGVAQLHVEAFENINRMLAETAQQLPIDSEDGMPLIQIVVNEDTPDVSRVDCNSGHKNEIARPTVSRKKSRKEAVTA